MLKLIFLAIIAGAAFFFYQEGFSLQSKYQSETGIGFHFPAKTTVVVDTHDMLAIAYPKPSTSQIRIYRILPTNPSSSLSFSITRDFSSGATDEQAVDWGREGIAFSWHGDSGIERAFAFEHDGYMYVLTTDGIDGKGLMYKDLRQVASSIVFD
jgi:hypothetical protein